MAEVIGLVASVITLGGVAASAAKLSIALFKVAHTLKNAPHEIAEIAEEISSLSGTLLTLEDFIDAYRSICKPALFQNTTAILKRYNRVEAELKKLIEDANSINKLKWPFRKCKAKSLLKKVEGIKTALMLELNIIQLARDEILQSQGENNATSQSVPRSNRFRKIVECAVAASRQVVESSQKVDAKQSEWKKRENSMQLREWDEDLFDTATWLYHLVFSPGSPPPYAPPGAPRELPYQASVSDENVEPTEDLPEQPSEAKEEPATGSLNQEDKALIVWSGATAPDLVVNRLLSTWTTLTSEQITHSSVDDDKDQWAQSLDKMIDEAKEEDDAEDVGSESDSTSSNDLEEEQDEWDVRDEWDIRNERREWATEERWDIHTAKWITEAEWDTHRSKLSESTTASNRADSIPRNPKTSSRKVRWDKDKEDSVNSKEPFKSSKPKAKNARRPSIDNTRRTTSLTVDSTGGHGSRSNPQREPPSNPARSA